MTMGGYEWKKHWVILVIFAVFVVGQSLYLSSVPGLLGDEGSEGENVYELLQADHITVLGERSYIGPWIDYARVPFMQVFGYTSLAVRLPMLLVSIALFWLAYSVLLRLFGQSPALWGIVFLTLSPIYISYQRLGWAITLLPFFAVCLVFMTQRKFTWGPLLTGLVAGVGLSTHIMFLPTLVALIAVGGIVGIKKGWRTLLNWWPSLIGFAAGFGMQLVVLILMKDDQGDPGATTALFGDRLLGLKHFLPLVISGSSFVASYTGIEFSPVVIGGITTVIVVLALLAFLLPKKKLVVLLMWVGLIIQILALTYIIDRYTLRYFLVPVLWLWLLAGLGVAALLQKVSATIQTWLVLAATILLSLWVALVLFVPFLTTGGSTNTFSLGNRTDSASSQVDIGPLVACLSDKDSVFSESVHIWNRLQYLSHSNSHIVVVPEDNKKEAEYVVSYLLPKDAGVDRQNEVCPDLEHFRVIKAK